MRFTNRYRLRRAVPLAGGGVHQSGAPRASHRLEDVERAADVGIDKGLGSLIAMWNRDQRRQVEDDLDVPTTFLDESGVANVSQSHVQGTTHVRRDSIQPPQGALAVVKAEGPDDGARLHQCFSQVASDEAVGAGHHIETPPPPPAPPPARRPPTRRPTERPPAAITKAPSPRTAHRSE